MLHHAAAQYPGGALESIKVLLLHGIVDGRLKNCDGKLALDVAYESGSLGSLYLLLVRAIEDSTITFFEWRVSQKRPSEW